jgi:hypothetical protein
MGRSAEGQVGRPVDRQLGRWADRGGAAQQTSAFVNRSVKHERLCTRFTAYLPICRPAHLPICRF